MLSTTVKTVAYSAEGVTVTLVDGKKLTADYALVTFSLGVLQHDDVTWEPEFPAWKEEAVQSMTMVCDFLLLRATPSHIWHIGHVYKDFHAVPTEILVRYRGRILY